MATSIKVMDMHLIVVILLMGQQFQQWGMLEKFMTSNSISIHFPFSRHISQLVQLTKNTFLALLFLTSLQSQLIHRRILMEFPKVIQVMDQEPPGLATKIYHMLHKGMEVIRTLDIVPMEFGQLKYGMILHT